MIIDIKITDIQGGLESINYKNKDKNSLMSSIWNFANTLRHGNLKMLNSGRELFGTVIQD